MTLPAPVCDCGTRKEPTAKRALLLCPHCDVPCNKSSRGCSHCREYTHRVSVRLNR